MLQARKFCLIAVGLAILIAAVYFPTFTGDFILDDRPLVKNNPYIRSGHSIISYLSQPDGMPLWHEGEDGGTGYYRPLVNLTLRMDYKIWGMNGSGFRTTNLILHLISCVLLFGLMKYLTGDTMTGFWVALLFGIHPVNTEAVSWVSSRNNILVLIFGLSSLHTYILFREKRRSLFGFISLVLFACALLSKEFAVVLLIVFFLWRLLAPQKEDPLSEVRAALPFLALVCLYLVLRHFVLGPHGWGAGGELLWKRLLFAPYLALLNTGLILLPSDLHSFIVPYPEGPSFWLKAIFGLFFIAATALILRVDKRVPFRLGVCAYLFSLLPVLNIVPIPSPTLVSMRWLYFPMAFLLMGMSVLIFRLARLRASLAVICLSAAAAYLGFYTYTLNRTLWHDEKAFFRQEVMGFKNLHYAVGLAEILYDEKDYSGAEKYFAAALRSGHATPKDMINYGALLIDRGKIQAALMVLEKAEPSRMSFGELSELHNNMGTAKSRLNRPIEAIAHFRKAVIYYSRNSVFWANLGAAYGAAGDLRKSMDAYRKGLLVEPDSSILRKGLALTFVNMQDYRSAFSILEEIPYARRDRDVHALLSESRTKMMLSGTSEPTDKK
ncbi:MAG: hypothetical protein C4576_17205 [Desulfobacteraceae bacterium]|nr:MAG: hypothetical protein C4576_17205 [Desulfobacteraceae bacterium]